MGKRRLTDLERKEILAGALEGESERSLAKRFGVSPAYVNKLKHTDTEYTQRLAQKKEENTVAVLNALEARKDRALGTIDRLLDALGDEDRIARCSERDLAVSMGILIDKFLKSDKPLELKESRGGVLVLPVADMIDAYSEEENLC